MTSDPLLWSASSQKEALDLLVSLWRQLDSAQQSEVVTAILAGPPAPDGADDRDHWTRVRDRQIFERLALLERSGGPALPQRAIDELLRIGVVYPQWRLESGERAHFSSWMEASNTYPGDFDSDFLSSRDVGTLATILSTHQEHREGLLEQWRALVEREPLKAIKVLRSLSASPGNVDVWATAFSALNRSHDQLEKRRALMLVFKLVPSEVLHDDSVLRSATRIVEEASKNSKGYPKPGFWRAWDRAANALSDEMGVVSQQSRAAVGSRDGRDFVDVALNSSAGDLASALLNIIFQRQLSVGQGLPDDLRMRLTGLVAQGPSTRYARVMCAWRLSYLVAIDKEWVTDHLLRYFDWNQSKEDAAAMWQAYASHGQVTVDVWALLAPQFFDCFAEQNLEALGTKLGRLLSILMVVGIDLPQAQPPLDMCRRAIRTAGTNARIQALSWIRRRMESAERVPENSQAATTTGVDRLWEGKIGPWLARVWPRDKNVISPPTSQAFGEVAAATDQSFDSAIDQLLPLMGPTTTWGYIVHELKTSRHPEEHPGSCLRLLGKVVSLSDLLFTSELRAVLERIAASKPELRQSADFRKLDEPLRNAGR